MRSLFVAASALCAVLHPLSSPCAQQAAESTTTSPVSGGTSYRLTVLENDRGSLLFRPVREEQAGPSTTVATSAPAPSAQSAAPLSSPAQADTPGQSSPVPGRPTDLNLIPAAPLYAPSSAVESAWNRFVPRQMAYAPRPWLAPDPAVHSALPVRRSAAKRAAGSGQTAQSQAKTPAATPAKTQAGTPVQQGFDALVSVVQTLCPPQTQPAAASTVAPASPDRPGPAAGAASAPARAAAAANPAMPR